MLCVLHTEAGCLFRVMPTQQSPKVAEDLMREEKTHREGKPSLTSSQQIITMYTSPAVLTKPPEILKFISPQDTLWIKNIPHLLKGRGKACISH